MTSQRKAHRIISNDDGWIMSQQASLVTPEVIRKKMIDTYEGSPVDAVCWCVGDHEVYYYETEIGERIGEGYKQFDDENDYWAQKNLNHLIETTGGPLTEISRQFREAGMDFFPSVRMNSHYDIAYDSPTYGRFRREHRQCLIGRPDECIPIPSIEHAIRTGLDYRFPVVREHMLAIACELFERFDVDGIELDYMRHPGFFRTEEACANRYLMTDFIRSVRARMDKVAECRGRPLDLLVRVPPTFDDCARLGLDVRRWIGQGLVDIVAAGGGFIPFEMPIKQFVEASEGTKCQIYGSFEALRWAVDEPVLRAMATRFWDAGVGGLYLFNYFNTPSQWKRRVLGELVDRRKLAHSDKRYEIDHADRVESKAGHMGAFRYAIPRAQLPVTMEETLSGGGVVLEMDIAEEIGESVTDGPMPLCTLGLGFDNIKDGDELEVSFNGQSIAWPPCGVSDGGWSYLIFDGDIYHTTMKQEMVPGTLIEYAVSVPMLEKGANEICVRLIKGPEPRSTSVILKEVRLSIGYKPKDAVGS